MQLSRKYFEKLKNTDGPGISHQSLLELPEKVIQFGSGVLLRGLPDYFIDKANRQGKFNGRVVIVKSTPGDTSNFSEQDNLYTILVRGIEKEEPIEENIINSCISRILPATTHWSEILACAQDPEIRIVVSNTTEVGIVSSKDIINEGVPSSFPGKLLAYLHERFKAFGGSEESGMVIIPTELISDNAKKLKSILLELAKLNSLTTEFIQWLTNSNQFCNSLVDRIVPGKLPEKEQLDVEEKIGYSDKLMIMAESFRLWAIESDHPGVREILSFSETDSGVIITPDIEKFKELKLRLLNGTHTFTCGLAFLAGFPTVKSAMENEKMRTFIRNLMLQESIEALESESISYNEAHIFANSVLDRFKNPYLNHRWHSITLNFTSKMRLRNIPLLQRYHYKFKASPSLMSVGFAAFLLFMKCSRGVDGRYYGNLEGQAYLIDDEMASYFSDKWKEDNIDKLVNEVLSDEKLWGIDLNSLGDFSGAVLNELKSLIENGAHSVIEEHHNKTTKFK